MVQIISFYYFRAAFIDDRPPLRIKPYVAKNSAVEAIQRQSLSGDGLAVGGDEERSA
jgi:hypothetical protein